MIVMVMNRPPLIALTLGDPLGIGPEIIVKALADPAVRRLGRFVIFGSHQPLAMAAADADTPAIWQTIPAARVGLTAGAGLSALASYPTAPGRRVHSELGSRGGTGLDGRELHNLLEADPAADVWLVDFDGLTTQARDYNRPSRAGGAASFAYLVAAIEATKAGITEALVTAPISKTAWRAAGIDWPGHTELLAHLTAAKQVAMMFAGGPLRVVLATIHHPLMALRDILTIGRVYEPIMLADKALREWFARSRPRIAVCGLNPHASENGQFGDEEERIITPAITMAAAHGVAVSGPYPADTVFRDALTGRHDLVVAMYHDQGLIPVKLLGLHESVNLTLGLPIIRTSPDHGTAYDIAGQNKAHPGSMVASIRMAADLVARRAGPALADGRGTPPNA